MQNKTPMVLRFIPLLLALACSTAVQAQNDEDFDQMFRIGRPERVDVVQDGRLQAPLRVGSQSTAPLTSMGSPKVPVVLVQFQDVKFSTPSSDADSIVAYYQTFCNGQGEAVGGNQYSVRDYFIQQSDSLFSPDFSIIGPVTLDNNSAYYGQNSGSTKDVNFNTFCIEAVQKAQALGNVDWTLFDNDGNETVDMVFFIYAGYSESSSDREEDIWPKESVRNSVINGITYSCYGATGELRITSKSTDANGETVIEASTGDGFGVFVHELSHALGLPDFYHTGSGTVVGMDIFSVMDYGEYCKNGYAPVGYTAYERDFMGWRQLVELSEPQKVTLYPLTAGGVGYKMTNSENSNEYYILENRQQVGADSVLARITHGMLVNHVEYSSSHWSANTLNNTADHQRMSFIAANNNYNCVGFAETSAQWREAMEGQLWPGTSLNYNLTDETIPCDTAYTGGYMHQPLRHISESDDGVITLYYCTNGELSAPENLAATYVGSDTVSLEWDEVENATNYQITIAGTDSVFQSTSPSITLTNLTGGTTITIQVQALADSSEDYLPSEWTSLEVTTVPTGINSAVDAQRLQNTEIYDLAGRKVTETARRGLYIQNGKKIIK